MEAMAAGIPVIATRVDGINDLVTNDVHGLLVPAEDPERLGNSILQLLRDPEMMKRIGSAGRAHVLQIHSTDDMCKKYYHLMLALLKNK